MMMIRSYIRQKNLKSLLFSQVAGWLALMAASSQAQTSLNVTNFGARGDAVQFYVNTTSNSVVVTTTNHLSSADIGKAIEVFGVGTQTYGKNSYGVTNYGNQDLVANITNVVNGTNIYLDQIPQLTLTNTFATYGTDNRTNFQNAINAANGTNVIINIPAGEYLLLSTNRSSDPTAWYSINLTSGGIHIIGEGTNNTVLLGQGAWTLESGNVKRGIIFAITPPITNDYPVSIENLTLDGGVQQGHYGPSSYPPNTVDGLGWDGSHGAIDCRGFTGNTFSHQTFSNLLFIHWRGEMVKSNDGSTNGNCSIVNCYFTDGNATAINYYPSLIVSNCVFNNLFQIAEYYQAYSTNTSYFENNLCTNITANGFAINGGKGNNPPFIIQNNTFYSSQNGYNTIETVPADNVVITNNDFIIQNNVHCFSIVLGASGYQGTFDNSNIVVSGNTFFNPYQIIQINGGISSTDSNRVESVSIFGNTLVETNTAPVNPEALITYGWATNLHFFNNDYSSVTNGYVTFSSGSRGSQFALVDTNNLYYTEISDGVGITNLISYANGSRFEIYNAFHTGTVYSLTDINASQIPAGAQILIYNDNTSLVSIPVFLNSALTLGPVMVANGQTLTVNWNGSQWTTNSVADELPVPLGLAIRLQ